MATEEEREAYLLAERLRSKERRARKREADNKVDNNLSCPSSDIPQTSGSSPQNTLTVQSNHSHEPDPSSQPLPSQPQPVAHRVPSTHKIARNFDHNNPPPPFSLGQLTELCCFCNALSFSGEMINCCHKGKVQIDLPPFPEKLENLFTGETDEATNFRRHIRKYNNSFSFASIQDNRKDAPPGVYKICGQMYTNTAGLLPYNQQPPVFNQLYVYSPSEANDLRLQNHHTDGCTSAVMEIINEVILEINPYCVLYKSMMEKYNEECRTAALQGRPPDRVQMHFLSGRDRRRYNAPTLNEIGAIFVGDLGAPANPPDIVVFSHQNILRRVPFLSCHADPLSFVLLFPDGHAG